MEGRHSRHKFTADHHTINRLAYASSAPSIRRTKVEQEPRVPNTRIRRTITEEAKRQIVDILTEGVAINSISTNLARQAEQYTTKVEVPEKYRQHARVFSEEAAQRFPPKRPWDHAIELKPDTPDVIDCKIYPLTQKKIRR